ncbi:MAG: hypothetical protein JWL90_3283 [Chthoniobacteraceae bacterium]|nr:hypothetical protein [Chthoniobacteraceae bacterium]
MHEAWRPVAVGFLTAICCIFQSASAQESEAPPAKKTGIQITFLPPPMEGRLSLGLYDKSGKLVRTLSKEALEKEFIIGLNGLITVWDGKNNGGLPVPPGKYSARGYSVGEMDVDGIAFHCNEWMNEAARVREIVSIYALRDGELLVHTVQPDGAALDLRCDRTGTVRRASPADSGAIAEKTGGPEPGTAVSVHDPLILRDGVLSKSAEEKLESLSLPGLEHPIDACHGLDRAVWVIDKTSAGVEVREYSSTGEPLRRLAIPPNEPEPSRIVASTETDIIYLLERNAKVVRLRGLALEPPVAGEAPAASTWKTFLSKSVVASDTFAAVADQLGRTKPFKPEEKIRVRLVPNPLFKEATQDVDVRIASDSEGSYFQSADGLLLHRITETPGLKWSVMGKEGGKVITIFQSDGAVVEEFKARRLANMMAFDAGEYEVSK